MTNHNFDDDRLVAFLKQHQPIAPPSDRDLQAQIMSQIQTMPRHHNYFSPVKIWLIGAAIVTTAVIGWSNYNRQVQPALSEADTQVLEASLVNSWSISSGEGQEFTTPYALLGQRSASQKSRYE